MAMFPKVESPCPYKGSLSDIMDGDVCRLCKREVFDLTAMNDGERVQFLSACQGEVCVTYAFKLRPAVAAAALAASAFSFPLAAQEAPAPTAAEVGHDDEWEIFVGGIKDAKNVEMIEDASDAMLADLPVEYEGEKPAD
jgi:predicted Fe-S protein YdhL (DUF1289 family)